jgi:hypothetical protein
MVDRSVPERQLGTGGYGDLRWPNAIVQDTSTIAIDNQHITSRQPFTLIGFANDRTER